MRLQTATKNDLSHLLHTWYIHMRANDLDRSIQSKNEIDDQLIETEEDNQTLLVYYSLLECRHHLLLKEFDTAGDLLSKIQPFKEHMTDQLNYYYYFFKGMHDFSQQDYEESLKNYKEAEIILNSLSDDIEQAEFHYMVSTTYYQIRQTYISLEHVKKAISIYERSKKYLYKVASCKVLLAANYVDMRFFLEAEALYHSAKDDVTKLDNQSFTSLLNHNIGLFYAEQNISKAAIRYLTLCLEDPTFNPVYCVKTIFSLTREYFKINEVDQAKMWLNKGLVSAHQINNKEYHLKLRVIQALYIGGNKETINEVFKEGISYFEDELLWVDAAEYAEQFARYYTALKAFETATFYYEKALMARQKIIEMEALK